MALAGVGTIKMKKKYGREMEEKEKQSRSYDVERNRTIESKAVRNRLMLVAFQDQAVAKTTSGSMSATKATGMPWVWPITCGHVGI